MSYKVNMDSVQESSGRAWRFADHEFDELRRELRVRGKPVELEAKPIDILLQLLLHAGEVVTKEELLESVWPDVLLAMTRFCAATSPQLNGFSPLRFTVPSGVLKLTNAVTSGEFW